jgi:hypothetical protein
MRVAMSQACGADADPERGPLLMAVGLLASIMQRAADDITFGLVHGLLDPRTLELTAKALGIEATPELRKRHNSSHTRPTILELGEARGMMLSKDAESLALAIHGLTGVYISPARHLADARRNAAHRGLVTFTPGQAARKAARAREARPAHT